MQSVRPCAWEGADRIRGNVRQFPGRLVFKAHRLVYHSILGWRVIKKKKTELGLPPAPWPLGGALAVLPPAFFFFFIPLKPRVE